MNNSVYIVDDDESVREVMIFALEDDGFVVNGFEDARFALKALRSLSPENYPDLILVDYRMPEMDGLTFIKELRATEFRNIPVLLNTAAEDIQMPEDIMSFPKPINLEDLIAVVRKFTLEKTLSSTSIGLNPAH